MLFALNYSHMLAICDCCVSTSYEQRDCPLVGSLGSFGLRA